MARGHLRQINSMGFPAFSGSCSEIYLEKCFSKISNYKNKRLVNAKYLGETSLMFLVHPTITISQMNSYAKAIKNVLIRALK